jgi:hypothetical protein
MQPMLWKCEEIWAGKRFNQIMFNSREEAETFVSTVLKMEPDQIFSIEEIRVEQVWN